MTISTAFLLPTGVLFYSDSRITYYSSDEKYKDIGQKIYTINGELVVSFAGDLESAQIVISTIENDLRNNVNLESYIEELPELMSNIARRNNIQRTTSFIFGGNLSKDPLEPKLFVKAFRLSNSQSQLIDDLCKGRREIVAIGSGSGLIREKTLREFCGKYRSTDNSIDVIQDATMPIFMQRLILAEVIKVIINNGSANVPDIGGRLQCVSIHYQKGILNSYVLSLEKIDSTGLRTNAEISSGFENNSHFYIKDGKKITLSSLERMLTEKNKDQSLYTEEYSSALNILRGRLALIFEPVPDLNQGLGEFLEYEGYEEIYRDDNLVEATFKYVTQRCFVKNGKYYPDDVNPGYILVDENTLFPLQVFVTLDIKKLHTYLLENNYEVTNIIKPGIRYMLDYWDREGHLIRVSEGICDTEN
ncbi:hypothetical protein P4629_11635 [Priestia aryabhattai]|uniref:hypothetical protein n=1 Tax=Priestia aryabhattai TaxID=412384 RepID=UPI002E1DD151|nr:hypothetical protein [Priestia aryabhattai]